VRLAKLYEMLTGEKERPLTRVHGGCGGGGVCVAGEGVLK
jgi:hypothetical protein